MSKRRSRKFAAYFEADTPANYRWFMRFLGDYGGTHRGSDDLRMEGFRDPPYVFDKDPRKDARVLDAMRAANVQFDRVWALALGVGEGRGVRERDGGGVHPAAYLPLNIGERTRLEAHGHSFLIGYHSRNTYWLSTDPPGERRRWGTRRQILEDIEHVLQFGTLPTPSGQAWAAEGRSETQRSRALRVAESIAGDPPTANNILEWLGPYMEHDGLDAPRESARLARLIANARTNRQVDEVLEEVNRVIGGHGVEAIQIEGAYVDNYYFDIVATYVNMGDPYNATLLYETANERFVLTTWGDWVEANEGEYLPEPEPEEEDDLDEARRPPPRRRPSPARRNPRRRR